MRLRNVWPLLACVAALAAADDNADHEIYVEYPAGVWGDWSWCTRDTASTTYARSYSRSCRVQLGAWTALRFHNDLDGQDATAFTHLEFWVHGGTRSGQKFGIKVATDGIEQAGVLSDRYSTVTAGQWKRFSIPLADLQAAGRRITDVFLYDHDGATDQPFWLDDMKLIRPLPTKGATIALDARALGASLTKAHFGMNTAIWDGAFALSSTRDRMVEAGYGIFRYPGGAISDTYDWRTHTSRNDGTVWQWGPNTAAFLQVANQVGVEKMVTINYGSGTPEEARDWLVYANRTLGGNVLFWNVGNECYGDWEYDLHPKPHDAVTYAGFVQRCYALMKPEDPRIKIGVVGTYRETDWPQDSSVVNPRTGQAMNGWSPVLLKRLATLGVVPDFYEIHDYPIIPDRESDANLLQSSSRWATILPKTRQMLVDYFGLAGATIPIFVGENNGGGNGKQMVSLVNGLFYVDAWAQAVGAGASSYLWWDLHNASEPGNLSASLYGWRNWGDWGVLSAGPSNAGVGDPVNTPYPTFYAHKLIRRFAGPGDRLVRATSSHPLLKVYGARSADGTVRMIVVNTARGLPIRADVSLDGTMPVGSVRWYRYGPAEDLAVTDAASGLLAVRGRTMRLTFAPYSITVLDFGRVAP